MSPEKTHWWETIPVQSLSVFICILQLSNSTHEESTLMKNVMYNVINLTVFHTCNCHFHFFQIYPVFPISFPSGEPRWTAIRKVVSRRKKPAGIIGSIRWHHFLLFQEQKRSKKTVKKWSWRVRWTKPSPTGAFLPEMFRLVNWMQPKGQQKGRGC